MTKGYISLKKEVPITDIKRALALMRYRTAAPTVDSLAYASLKLCSRVLCISYEQTRKLLKAIVKENCPLLVDKQINSRSNRRK